MLTKEKVAALTFSGMIAMAFAFPVAAAFAARTTYDTTQTVAQTNWRAYSSPFGAVSGTYEDSGPYTYVATGNSLHESFQYEPAVANQQGGNHTYSFHDGAYYMHSGIISYDYMGETFYNVWNGSISFNGAPISDGNTAVTTGQLNQWIFVYSPGVAPYANAVDAGNGWWLTGFSTYTYGSTSAPSSTAFFALALAYPHLPG